MEATTINRITSLRFEGQFLIVLTENKTYKCKFSDISGKLAAASEMERNNFKISPSGYGIHWPLIDEDLSLSGLIKQLKQ